MSSQSNEDEIIRDIFSQIGYGGKRFVEFGCGDGRQNNTIALLVEGWSGVWLDPHKRRIESARLRWSQHPVQIIRRFVTPENVNRVFKELPVDFLSIDIDGNDYLVWKAIACRPRVVCIEYCLQNIEKGNSIRLHSFNLLAQSKGYRLHGVSDSKVNAFYIYEG